MPKSVIGVLAHVDAGKTTLSEALLCEAGAIRTRGRVDHGDSFLDTEAEERRRGITIFSKEARLSLPGREITLLDTPGHADLAPEAERTLDVLDAAVLVISGSEGVQSHSETLWRLLKKRRIPTFIFINKMDLPGAGKAALLQDLRARLGGCFFDLADTDHENAATADEAALNEYLENGELSEATLRRLIRTGLIFPCRFGSALKGQGAAEFLRDLERFSPDAPASEEFGAKVFKITHDAQGVRLTHVKITGGVLRPRDTVSYGNHEEKITQLKFYDGARASFCEAASAGDVVAVAGLSATYPGLGLGAEGQGEAPALLPVQSYALLLPEGSDTHRIYLQLKELEEEEPSLRVSGGDGNRSLHVQLMGPVQREVLQTILKQRFGLEADFGPGEILYRETLAEPVEGIGHYEPLRHYAEVHLLLEPAPRGSGLSFASDCPPDSLALHWQRLILTHLQEKTHLGVLTGSPLTDVRITVLSGKAHEKHTEGGDFREATYRAVRQALMQARSILLEPQYEFTLELPLEHLGRAMTDLEQKQAETDAPVLTDGSARLCGRLPASALGDSPLELASYTHGSGRLTLSFGGYAPCLHTEETVAQTAYDPEADLENTPDSIFCSHGAGTQIRWSEVPRYMHLPSAFPSALRTGSTAAPGNTAAQENAERTRSTAALPSVSDDELMAIFERTYGKIRSDRVLALRPGMREAARPYRGKEKPRGREYVLVDGYNVIFSWDSLRRTAAEDLESARFALTERLKNYQGFTGCPLILVFDAYKVRHNPGSVEKQGDFTVVYTKEAETADMYIEKATYDLAQQHTMRVVTGDALEQMIILGHGALRVPARLFEKEIEETEKLIRDKLSR